MDPSLNWHQHIKQLKTKLSKSIYALKRLCGELEEDGLRQAYFGLFQAHIAYGLVVWGGAPKAHEILLMQKKALRVISGKDRLAHCRPIFIELRLLTVFSLYILQCLMFLRSNLDKVQTRSSVHDHNTRSNQLIDLPKIRLHKSELNPITMSSRLMNNVPDNVRHLDDKNFKNCVTRFLLNNPFYSLEEFTSRKWTDTDFEL